MTTVNNSIVRLFRLGLAALAALAVVAVSTADARPGGGKNSGSRGERTYNAPATTNTAPKAAAPIERSMTQPGKAAAAGAATAGAATAAAQAAKPSMMRNLLLGGLMGAGLMALFGMGGGLASVLGFILQAVVIAAIVMLIIAFIRNRMGGGTPATAAAAAGGSGQARQPDMAAMMQRQGMGAAGAAMAAPNIGGDDFNAFEQRLHDIQLAYGRGDVDALGRMATPEMLSYFAGELHENKQKGLRNDIADPKLLQGDLSETWREANAEYATVAMRYSLFDVTIDSAGRVVAGSKTEPAEATELWTFVRPVGGRPDQWELSAIQQAA